MTELTEAQERVLGIVKGYIEEHGYAPSTRDVMRAMGTSSTNGAHDHLAALKKKGYITWDKGVARSIRIVGPVDPGTVSYRAYRGHQELPPCGDERSQCDHEHLVEVARDVVEWLCSSGLGGSGHARSLAQALGMEDANG